MIFSQLYLATMSGVEGQLPLLLACLVGASILSGIYTAHTSGQPLAAVNAMQSNGAQLVLAGLCGVNLLTGNAGLAALFLFGFMGLEAFTSNTLWFASNGQSATS